MIFPDLPRQKFFLPKLQPAELCPRCNSTIKIAPGIGPFCPNKDCDVKDDLESAKQEIIKTNQISAEEWFQQHFPDQNIASQTTKFEISPGQRLREQIEFGIIVVGMIIWAWYWHQFQ
jgi:hypothetical protein